MPQLKIVPRLSITAQTRRAIAEYKAERNGQRRLTDAEVARVDDLTIFERINGEIVIDNHFGFRLTWREVFDCKVALNLFGVAERAKASGYRFFVYARVIYFAPGRGAPEDTGLTVEEIEQH